jgi:hypothetical protein
MVPTDDGAIQGDTVNRIVGRFYDRGQQRSGLLRLMELRDVAKNGGTGRHFAGGVPDGERSNGYVNPASVLAPAHPLELRDGVASQYLFGQILEASPPPLRHYHRNVLTNGVSGGVAQNRFRSPVPGKDVTGECERDNSVRGTLHDSGEKLLRIHSRRPFGHVMLLHGYFASPRYKGFIFHERQTSPYLSIGTVEGSL